MFNSRKYALFELHFDSIITIFPDEAIITARAMDFCAALEMQEFARIQFVDDVSDFQKQPKDHEPLAVRPAYTSLDYPKAVSLLRLSNISHR